MVYRTKYFVSKSGFGFSNSWEYEARPMYPDPEFEGDVGSGITRKYNNIDELAKELSTFPGIIHAEFYPHSELRSVSLNGKSFTQKGVLSDEELGNLGLLVLKYADKIN